MKSYKMKLLSTFILSCISIFAFSQANNFHDTKGNIEVTKAGQLQYTLTIDAPPGVKKVGPNISLTYTSSGQNGLAGYGCNITGLSSISRIGKNLEKDGIAKRIQLDYSDFYSFNGQRLILKSGEYGKNGAEYVTENYSNIKIKSVGTVTGQTWQGPAYWQVIFSDGSQAWYGAAGSGNSSARNAIDYNIVKTRDVNGNYVTYNYVLNGNVSVISSIQWGGNETQNTPHFNKIEFNFGTRPTAETAYLKGVSFVQSKLLESIIVTSNNKLYKKYIMSYKQDSQYSDYRFLEKIIELNSNNEEATPVVFTYESSGPDLVMGKSTSLRPNNDTDVVGDFDGDGKLDLLRYHSSTSPRISQPGVYLYKDFYSVTYNTENPLFISNSLQELKNSTAVNFKKDNTIYSKQGFATYKTIENGLTGKYDLLLNFYTVRDNNELSMDIAKIIPGNLYDKTEGINHPTTPGSYKTTSLGKTLNVDLNGDGLSELLLELNDNACTRVQIPNPGNPYEALFSTNCTPTKRYFLLQPDENSVVPNLYSEFSFDYENTDIFKDYKIGDFNGDGLVDLLRKDQNNKPVLITFQKNVQGKYEINISPFNSANTQIIKGDWANCVAGDFNGDGLSDLMIPETATSEFWYLYTSRGNIFNEEKVKFVEPKPDRTVTQNLNNTIHISNPRSFIAYDLNNDGKAELVGLHSHRNYIKENIQDSNQGVKYKRESVLTVDVFSISGGEYTSAGHNFSHVGGAYDRATIYLNNNNIDAELAPNTNDFVGLSVDQWTGAMLKKAAMVSAVTIAHDFGDAQRLLSYTYYDILKGARIKSILQGGNKTEITYKQLDKTINPGLYDVVKTEIFPYVEINQSTGMYVVSQISQSTLTDKTLKQDFRYRGLTSNILGRGMVGFRKSARSSWYAEGFENTKIWSGLEIDPVNDGIPIKEWSMRTNDESNIFTVDVSENNTQLLSYKATTYQIDKIIDGQAVTNIPDADKAKVVTAILPKVTRSKDFITNVTSENTITYGEYYLPTQNIAKVNNTFSVTTSTYAYFNNPSGTGVNYYIGRPKSKTDVVQAYNDTKSGKEEYTYQSNMLKTIKKWNRDNTGYSLETYTYDGFGNIIKKVDSNSIDAITITASSQYDAEGRFIVKTADNLGLETETVYNDLGRILTQKDPFGNTLSYTYDDWGKLLTLTSSLGGTSTFNYERDNASNITVTKIEPNGNVTKSFTNRLGQEYKVSTKAYGQGQFVTKEIQYDLLGRKVKESEPYFEGQSASQWNIIAYDDSVFPAKIKTTAYSGKQTETSVLGLTTNVKELNGYARTTKKTVDALGNIVSSTDKGGTVSFNYNAAGEQIRAVYAENKITTQYDAWGRKSMFNDPSNGIYQYEYNGLGQIKKIVSPKGDKQMIYNTLGQLTKQTEISIDGSTNKSINFVYNNFGKVISTGGESNGKVYSVFTEFDPKGRLKSIMEMSNDRMYFLDGIVYDDKSRLKSYYKILVSAGLSSQINIENVYNDWNGELYQIKDVASGKILWQLKETNSRGQVTAAKLGTSDITNTYNSNGFLTNVNHSSQANASILQISYTFDALKNELKSRTTGGDFNIFESFTYDDNNRLVKWTDPRTGQGSSNIYDVKGRITQNDQLGQINYEDSSSIYRSTSIDLNSAGSQNYSNDLLQIISYNENNDPVYIDGLKGDVGFQYGVSSMRQRITYGGNFDPAQEGKFTKFYNEDGTIEITRDNTTGKEKHVIYIGSSPYESDIIYVRNYTETTGSYKFLHKDYLGSILAISDEAGNKQEQRHYDGWGNITHLKVGNGIIITDKSMIATVPLLIDRGYTGHEHLGEVGIIHMNGRLYDPLLRRFLNADENIQDATNTQNYNKYGYVLNNPLIYNDPNGEFWWWAAGALVGGYLSGVQANGSWNPGKWDWENTWSAVLGGAIGGAAISGAIGNIASDIGTVKNFLPGIVSGGLNSAFSGSNFLGGVIGGISYTSNIFENKMTSTDIDFAGYGYSVSEMLVSEDNILSEATEAVFSRDTVAKVENAHYKNQFIRGSWQFVDETSDLSPYLRGQGYSFGGNKDLLMNGSGNNVWGLTEILTHNGSIVWQRIYLPKGSFISLEQLDLTMGHEIFHSILNNARLFDDYTRDGLNRKSSVHEYYTSRWEEQYVKFRGWQKLNLSIEPYNSGVIGVKNLETLMNKIKPIFNNYLKSTLK